MSVDSVALESFDIVTFLKLDKVSVFWVYVKGEWRLHQIGIQWQVVPEQRLLYRAFDVDEKDCEGLDAEIAQQPQGPTIRIGK